MYFSSLIKFLFLIEKLKDEISFIKDDFTRKDYREKDQELLRRGKIGSKLNGGTPLSVNVLVS